MRLRWLGMPAFAGSEAAIRIGIFMAAKLGRRAKETRKFTRKRDKW